MTQSQYRYLIFGAGAIGTLLGGLLAKAGHSVTFIGRKYNVDAINSKGIKITGKWGNHTVSSQSAYETLAEVPDGESNYDYIFICTKAFNTEEAIKTCIPVINDNTYVIPIQNGYGNCQTIAKHIGWQKTLGARIITGVELTEPGHVNVTVHADSMRLGHYNNAHSMDFIKQVIAPLKSAEIPVEPTDQLEQFIWAKILYNSALNPMGALLGVTYGALAEEESTRILMERIIQEAFEVTHSHGIKQFWMTPDEYMKAFYDQMIPTTAQHYPSMLRDIERKRRTEVDCINGAISRLGFQKKIPTPTNDTIISLIHFREANYLK